MAEYIEREAAINCCFAITTIIKCGISVSDAKRILEAFNEIPAADVRPVVRGKWVWTVDDDEYLGEYWKCNLCGEHSYIGYNYCPNCGADMRETEDEKA